MLLRTALWARSATIAIRPESSNVVITPQLREIRAEQLVAGPGVRIGPLRNKGVNARSPITNDIATPYRLADGRVRFTKKQSFVIHHRNDTRLTDLSTTQQRVVIDRWYTDASPAAVERIHEEVNRRRKMTVLELRREDRIRRRMLVRFTFLGTATRFTPSHWNFCLFHFYRGSALPAIGSLPPQKHRHGHTAATSTTADSEGGKGASSMTGRATAIDAVLQECVFDKTRLSLVKRDSFELAPDVDAAAVSWIWRCMSDFAALTPEEQEFFRLRREARLWQAPNSYQSVRMRFHQQRRQTPAYQQLRQKLRTAGATPQHAAAMLDRLLEQEWKRLAAARTQQLLDTSHLQRFPLKEAGGSTTSAW